MLDLIGRGACKRSKPSTGLWITVCDKIFSKKGRSLEGVGYGQEG